MDGEWITHDGGRCPFKRTDKVQVQIRCRSRRDAEAQRPEEVRWWKRWTHDGGPGDIIAVRKVEA